MLEPDPLSPLPHLCLLCLTYLELYIDHVNLRTSCGCDSLFFTFIIVLNQGSQWSLWRWDLPRCQRKFGLGSIFIFQHLAMSCCRAMKSCIPKEIRKQLSVRLERGLRDQEHMLFLQRTRGGVPAPHGGSQPPMTSVPGDLTQSSKPLWLPGTHVCTYTYVGKTFVCV